MKVKSLSCVRLFPTQWNVAYQAPLSMEFSRQEYWSGLPFPSPGDLPNPGIKPGSPLLQADTLPSEPPGKPRVQGGTQAKSRGEGMSGKEKRKLGRERKVWSDQRKWRKRYLERKIYLKFIYIYFFFN